MSSEIEKMLVVMVRVVAVLRDGRDPTILGAWFSERWLGGWWVVAFESRMRGRGQGPDLVGFRVMV